MIVRANRIIQTLIVAFILLTTAPTFAASTIYVDADATGANDGSSWANAYNYIQDAINDSNDGYTIIVADGLYTGEGNRDIDFNGKAIILKSENGPEKCIIDCNGTEAELHRGFSFRNGEDANSVVEGLTITNGFHRRGGGILCIASSPIIRNNIITGNKIEYDFDGGGGIGCWDGASPLIVGNTISDNHCEPGGGGGGICCRRASSPTITDNIIAGNSASQGSGILCYGSPTISNCTFRGNTTLGMGGGILIDGSPILTNCTFSGNSADSGGAIYNSHCSPTLTNCRFIANSARYSGGAIFNTRGSSPILRNCIFTGNTAGINGGAIYNHGYTGINEPVVVNCTFADNSALYGNALAFDSYLQRYPSDIEMTNCLLWDGGNEIWNNDNSVINITYSDVEGGWPGSGNIDADPYFVDPGYLDSNGLWINGDYHLLPDSPCIDTGDPNYIAGPNETDLDGKPRVIGGRIDMGAYESRVIYVDDDSTGANNGSSWNDAFNFLQDALAVAYSGDEIRVAKGTYKPDLGAGITPGDREATFQLINGVALKGGYAGCGEKDPDERDIDLYETILSGDLDGNDLDVNEPSDLWDEPTRAENSYHVVTGSGTGETTFLGGFTVCGGNADGRSSWTDPNSRGAGMYNSSSRLRIFDCTFTENFAVRYGGGMANQKSDLTVINCTFRANYAPIEGGGGIYNNESSPTLINCMFIENSAYDIGGEGTGGGMWNWKSKPNIIGCTFRENTASYDGGGVFNEGGTPLITRCTFINNGVISLTGRGGGISNLGSNLTLTNCTFADNSANTAGGAIYNGYNSNSILINCVFSGNLASGWYSGARGGAICSYSSYLDIKHCTFFANSASYGNALACKSVSLDPPSNIQIANCILWDGGDEIWKNDDSVITINYSDVQGGWMGDGNIDADPCFVDLGYWDINDVWIVGDYHLLPDSPCVDTGDPNYIAEPNETDLDGKPRVLDGDNDGVPVVDMGAYEYRFTISAEARILPQAINLASKGNWITCYIWLTEEYDVADIEPDSIFLEDEIQPEQFLLNEDQQVVIARFDREDVLPILEVGDIDLIITGRLTDGTVFEAADTIKVINKAGK